MTLTFPLLPMPEAIAGWQLFHEACSEALGFAGATFAAIILLGSLWDAGTGSDKDIQNARTGCLVAAAFLALAGVVFAAGLYCVAALLLAAVAFGAVPLARGAYRILTQ